MSKEEKKRTILFFHVHNRESREIESFLDSKEVELKKRGFSIKTIFASDEIQPIVLVGFNGYNSFVEIRNFISSVC